MRKSLITLFASLAIGTAFAGESAGDAEKKEFTPSGKAFAQIHANYNQTYVNDSLTETGMHLTRAYFGYGYYMTENWSAKVKVDVATYKPKDLENANEEYEEYSKYREIFLKEASLSYKKGNLKAKGGLIGLVQHKYQEKYWGHRYVYKSFQDAQKMSASADIGIILDYKIIDQLSVDFTARNGEGYKKIQGDKAFKQMLGLNIKPNDMFFVRGFASFGAGVPLRNFEDMDKAELIYGGLLGVKAIDKITAGVEYTMQSNAKNKTDDEVSGYSIYGTYKISDKFQAFARYDAASWSVLDKKTTIDPVTGDEVVTVKEGYDGKSNTAIIAGVQYKPYKKIKFAFDYQFTNVKKDDVDENGFFIHADIKF